MRRRDLTVEGVRVAAFELGEGEPLVLIHGYPQSHRCWLPVVPALARSRRVIALDWFGWGESERSLAVLPRYTDEIRRVGAVGDALGLSRVDLVGHDYGGLLALGFATCRPERVERLALINTRAHRTPSLAGYLQFGAMCWAARIPGLRWLLARLPWYRLHARSLRAYVANGSFSEGDLERYVGWLRTLEGRRWLAHFYRYFRVVAHPELGAAAEHLAMPVALVWGDRDPFFPIAIAEDLSRRIPNARLTRIAGADHFVMEERPTEVAAALLELLETPATDAGSPPAA